MQPPSISLNFNLAKLLLFLIPVGYVPPFAEIGDFCRKKICRSSLFRLIRNCIESSTIAESLASHTLHPAIPLY